GMTQGQTQISRFASSSSGQNLFRYNHENAMMEFVLTFNFSNKLGFKNWMKKYVQPTFKPFPLYGVRKNIEKLYALQKTE
ncbi:hypothetical protein J0J24_24685, partial [Vibrio vulnificus]|uniref:hypothetical protein n=1 Tax=Vibrio vulnificus TaxID=672 RepID=UPI0019D4BB98